MVVADKFGTLKDKLETIMKPSKGMLLFPQSAGDFDGDKIYSTTELEIMYELNNPRGIREFINGGYYSINCISKYIYGKFDKRTWKKIKKELKYYKKIQNRKGGK